MSRTAKAQRAAKRNASGAVNGFGFVISTTSTAMGSPAQKNGIMPGSVEPSALTRYRKQEKKLVR
jgi:hypothetical protein